MKEEFDEEFKKSLKEVVSGDRLSPRICYAIQCNNESRLIKPKKIRELIYKLNRVSLKWLCDFNRVNFVVGLNLIDNNRLTFRQKLFRLLKDKTRTTSKRWPTFVLVIYLLCVSLAAFNTYFFYIYDANKAKLRKLREHLSDPGERNRLVNRLHLDVDELESRFKQAADQAREIIRPFFGHYIEFSFISECILVLFSQTIAWIILFPISHQVGNSVWLSVEAILDQDDKHKTRYELILRELEHFQRDSLLFARVKRERFYLELAGATAQEPRKNLASSLISLFDMQSYEKKEMEGIIVSKHRRTMEQLKLIALDGRLNPFNRTPVGRDKQALICLATYLLFGIYSNLLFTIAHYYFQDYFKADAVTSKMDDTNTNTLAGGIVWILIETGIIMATFFTIIMILAVFDQLEMSKYRVFSRKGDYYNLKGDRYNQNGDCFS